MSKKQRVLWMPVLVSLIFAGTAFAAAPIADVSVDASTLVFQPRIDGPKAWTLTVTGPEGFHFHQSFKGGAAPSFDAFAQTGLVDGVYTYELVAAGARRAAVADRTTAGPELERLVLSGHFSIADGLLLDPDLPEETLTKDQVIADDLIVDGSLCVGLDCVNGEVFSFDTIRLKENNLRIKFDDTSVAAGFPANDWQLTANESANGGASKFSIEDISNSRTVFTVEANAPSHSLYVDDGGRIGFGTSTPVVELHVIDGDTPTLRLQQDNSSGFEPQTWDVAGNETNFFVRDVTGGSALPFRIRPGAATNSIFVDVNSEVGIGTSAPERRLHVRTTSGTPGLIIQDASAAAALRTLLELENNGAVRFTFEDTTGATWRLDNSGGNFFIRDSADNSALELTAAGDLTIDGEITTSGSCNIGCDRVFQPEYEVESIEAHAAFMWENSHLPGVGPTPEDGRFNLTEKTGGILNELEKAHIYIDQLNQSLRDKDERLARLEAALFEGKTCE